MNKGVSIVAIEAEALASVLDWSVTCPPWQRDALRRLITAGALQPADHDELVGICKGNQPAVFLQPNDLHLPAVGHEVINLRQVHSVQHVNTLAGNQKLILQEHGMTVIYGDNGSGKSGYARILRSACHARVGKNDNEILPNIYDQKPGKPSASIQYSVNGNHVTCNWQNGQPADDALAAVCVFDSQTANVHVESPNDVVYSPLPLEVLANLVAVCKAVSAKLNAEITALRQATPEAIKNPPCQHGTAVHQLVTKLTATTEPEAIEQLSTLTKAEEQQLAQLTVDIADDPARTARKLSALQTQLGNHVARLARLDAAISDDAAQNLRAMAIDCATKNQAALVAGGALFQNEPLPHVGSEVWQTLWESARAFSVDEAYPDHDFPVTHPGSVCVLCQQPLSPEASDRLRRFEHFVQDDSQQRADVALSAYEEALEDFDGAAMSRSNAADLLVAIRDELRMDELAKAVRRYVSTAKWRHRQIRRKHANTDQPLDALKVGFPKDALEAQIQEIATRAAALNADADAPARKSMIQKYKELADRKWLANNKADVLAEIDRRKTIAALSKALDDTTTNRITAKSTEIAKELVTDALRARFAQEIASLGVSDLALELKQQHGAYGVPRFKVQLVRKPDAPIDKILSEGEHRCVALSAFLAELATAGSESAIVFDDPISSLDHMHREEVAKRLVQEASKRQVVVFTHDLPFLFMLDRAVEKSVPKPDFVVRSVTRLQNEAGICHNNAPFKTLSVDGIVARLRKRLDNECIHHKQGNEDAWRVSATSILRELRQGWEQAVAEVVGFVVQRFNNKVKTDGLVRITPITVQDCETMRDGFEHCSGLLHHAAEALGKPLPKPDDVRAEVEALATWHKDVAARQAAVKKIG